MAGIMFEKEETAISRAIFDNDVNALKAALKSGEDPHYMDRKGNTYLHHLCTMYRPFLIHVIFNTGIDLNAQNRHGNTALHVTALQNECCHVGDLLAAGIDPKLKNKDGKTAAEIPTQNFFWKSIYGKFQPGIFDAIVEHDVEKVLYLLHCWSRIDTMRNGLTLRQFAASHKHHDIIFHIDFHRHTLGAIHAVLEGDEERAKTWMSSAKCNINYVNYAMESKHILQEALKQQNYRLVHMICSSRVNVNVRVRIHSYLKAPLFFAALHPKQSENIMWTILRAGADFSLKDERGRNAGIYALDRWKGEIPLEVISFMLKKGLDISQRDETGVTLRDVAKFSRRKDILTLIDKAYVKLIRTSNITELERLCMRGYDGMVIKFNYRDTFIYASGNETEEVLHFVQWIPTFCLQVRRLFHSIQHKSLDEIINILEGCKRKDLLLNAVDKGGRGAIHRCVLCWRSDVLKELIRRKCDLNLQDNSGRTAYHYACALEEEDERKELCSLLQNAGIDQTLGDFQGHVGEFNVGNKKSQIWIAKERKTTYGMVKQLCCVDKYEELCHMMKYRRKTLKHFNVAVCNFKYPVPKFDEILQPLMPEYRDLLFLAMDSGKEDIARCLVQLGANYRKKDKTNVLLSQDSESCNKNSLSVSEKAVALGMTELVETIEKQEIHEKKKIQERRNEEIAQRERDNKHSKISKIRKMKPGSKETENKSDCEDNGDDILFEEEVVSDSDDDCDDLNDYKEEKQASDMDDEVQDFETFETSDEDSEDSFYSDDFDA